MVVIPVSINNFIIRKIRSISLFLLFAATCRLSLLHAQANSNNPLLADPAIFYYNGVYYLYGTGGHNNDKGFKVFTSTDKKIWRDGGFVLKAGESYGTKGFWAPQVFKYNGKFYMAYTANEHIAIAVADHPSGPFKQHYIQPLDDSVKMIDPFVYFDASGKIYLYHVRLQKGNRIFVAALDKTLSHLQEKTLKECIHADAAWENTQQAGWGVTEGPTIVKHNNWYYLIYSANDFRNPDYAVGYAIAKSPLGPWKKYNNNPFLSKKNTGFNGTGHGDILIDKSGKMLYVFHIHNDNTNVSPRKTAIIHIRFEKQKHTPDEIVAERSTFRLLKTSE